MQGRGIDSEQCVLAELAVSRQVTPERIVTAWLEVGRE